MLIPKYIQDSSKYVKKKFQEEQGGIPQQKIHNFTKTLDISPLNLQIDGTHKNIVNTTRFFLQL